MALQKGLYPVVKASLTGSIIGNILLVLGAAVLAGGIKFKRQKFNATAARAQATMLTLAADRADHAGGVPLPGRPGGRVRERRPEPRNLDRPADHLRAAPAVLAAHPQAVLRRCQAAEDDSAAHSLASASDRC